MHNPAISTLIDPNLHGRFYYHPVKILNEETGIEEWTDVLYIEIRAKGQKNSSFSRNLSNERTFEEYKAKFPRAWMEFNNSGEMPIDGTPLSELPVATPALINTLRELNILSIEDLANATDAACIDIREGYKFRRSAQAYIDSMNAFNEPMKEVKTKPIKSEESEKPEIEDLTESPQPKPRGRPKSK